MIEVTELAAKKVSEFLKDREVSTAIRIFLNEGG